MAIVFNPFTGGFFIVPNPTFPGTLVIASGKTLTASNSLTLAGTDGTTMTFPTTSATVARTDAGQTFAGTQTFSGSVALSNGSSSVMSIYFPSIGTNSGWEGSAGVWRWYGGGALTFQLQSGFVQLPTDTAQITLGTSSDVRIARDAANVLAQRNSTAAQTLRVYNTFTTVATAGEWWKADWQGTANQFRMGAVAGSSSGSNRAATWDYGDKLASATAAITVPATSGNIVFGGGVQLSNAAVTGLTPGALAALTTATIVLYDSTGQAYRVPCVI